MLVIIWFSVWCETCRYQCLENFLGGLAEAATAPLGHKWPQIILLDCVSSYNASGCPFSFLTFPAFYGILNQIPQLHSLLLGS